MAEDLLFIWSGMGTLGGLSRLKAAGLSSKRMPLHLGREKSQMRQGCRLLQGSERDKRFCEEIGQVPICRLRKAGGKSVYTRMCWGEPRQPLEEGSCPKTNGACEGRCPWPQSSGVGMGNRLLSQDMVSRMVGPRGLLNADPRSTAYWLAHGRYAGNRSKQ